jgi:hypothetical protein
MAVGSFLFLKEQIKDIIIIGGGGRAVYYVRIHKRKK